MDGTACGFCCSCLSFCTAVCDSLSVFCHFYLQLLTNKAYMVLLVCFGSGIGIFTCFSTFLEQILCVKGYTNVRTRHRIISNTKTHKFASNCKAGLCRNIPNNSNQMFKNHFKTITIISLVQQSVHWSGSRPFRELFPAHWNVCSLKNPGNVDAHLPEIVGFFAKHKMHKPTQ